MLIILCFIFFILFFFIAKSIVIISHQHNVTYANAFAKSVDVSYVFEKDHVKFSLHHVY